MSLKTAEKKSSRASQQRREDSDLWRAMSFEPAPIDMAAFGKRLGEIITKAVRASRKRHNSRA